MNTPFAFNTRTILSTATGRVDMSQLGPAVEPRRDEVVVLSSAGIAEGWGEGGVDSVL